MAPEIQEVFEAALGLPETQRMELVEQLMETLPPDPEETSEDQLLAELHRRRDEVHAGTAQGVPWSEVKIVSLNGWKQIRNKEQFFRSHSAG